MVCTIRAWPEIMWAVCESAIISGDEVGNSRQDDTRRDSLYESYLVYDNRLKESVEIVQRSAISQDNYERFKQRTMQLYARRTNIRDTDYVPIGLGPEYSRGLLGLRKAEREGDIESRTLVPIERKSAIKIMSLESFAKVERLMYKQGRWPSPLPAD